MVQLVFAQEIPRHGFRANMGQGPFPTGNLDIATLVQSLRELDSADIYTIAGSPWGHGISSGSL